MQDYTGQIYLREAGSSGPITGTRRRRTVWCLSVFVRELEFADEEAENIEELTRSFWTDISAKHRSTGKHRLDVRLRIF